MPGEDAHFGVRLCERTQTGDVRPDRQPVEPLRGEIELRVGGQGVVALEQPAVPFPDRHTTMSARVSEERNQIHLRRKRQADRVEAEPRGGGVLVKRPTRAVGEVQRIVAPRHPPTGPLQGGVLAPVDVNVRVWEIRQATGMVEVQVC